MVAIIRQRSIRRVRRGYSIRKKANYLPCRNRIWACSASPLAAAIKEGKALTAAELAQRIGKNENCVGFLFSGNIMYVWLLTPFGT